LTQIISIKDLQFEVRRSARRKSVEITIDRDGGLLVAAPADQPIEILETYIRDRLTWIYSKLAEKDSRRHSVNNKEYVTGEGFWYLGRSYRLLIVKNQDEPLALRHGRFSLRADRVECAHNDFQAWYTEHAKPWIRTRVSAYEPRIRVTPSRIEIRDLKNRWASCGKGQVLYFHWATILLPPRIVEYLIIHELVHLIVPHHTTDFWKRVGRIDPDYEYHKRWLGDQGSRYLAMLQSRI
jgi:predicted metal-dependent hydrolase